MYILPKSLTDYPWYLRPFFWNQRRRYGRVLKPGLLWARSPKVFAGLALLYGALDRKNSPLTPMLRSMVTVKVSMINWCAFCIDINSSTLLKRGFEMEKLQALDDWRESQLFDERERAVLEYVERVTVTNLKVDEATMNGLKRHFSDDAIVELTALICFQNMSSKFNAALGVPAEGFCQLPEHTTKDVDHL
ncbi:MAG: carboxymuconolactone decarboxylase family protein [Oligoflexales bacterium]